MVQQFFKSFWEHTRPRSFYSWQSALGLSLLAWLLSLLTQRPDTVGVPWSVHSILTNFGWVFLIIAMGWFTTINPPRFLGLSLGPWLTGILVCLFLFIRGEGIVWTRAALVSWPLVSMAIAAFPEFIKIDSGFEVPRKVPTRQWLMTLLLANLVLTCWLFLGFRIQDWLAEYPGLKGELFDRSAFVIRSQPSQPDYSRGVEILNQMVQQVRENTEGRTMDEIERWLFEVQRNPKLLRDAVMARLTEMNQGRRLDQSFWQVEMGIGEPEYQLTLGARWQGPRSMQQGYVVQQVCQVGLATNNRGAMTCDQRNLKVLR